MITVKFVRDDSRRITGVFMNGHAGYSEEGSDIVCAGASTLIFTLANSLETVCGLKTEDSSNIVEGEDVSAEVTIPQWIFADDKVSDRAQVIAETIHTGFITLAASVNGEGEQYINIIEDN
ncbi:MAG: ribosomal-processing cysteine protease Prp [Clostridiales bacterium]|nr:ribosomal-processing cysteine protease Prp [Clostridiales bacterium]MBR6483396.1 ribosomal-processing cysteine protease Prp [Clostridiales bacterium]